VAIEHLPVAPSLCRGVRVILGAYRMRDQSLSRSQAQHR
jgi:hypothetical protein